MTFGIMTIKPFLSEKAGFWKVRCTGKLSAFLLNSFFDTTFKKLVKSDQAWYLTSGVWVLRLRKEDCEFRASLGYITRASLKNKK